MYPRINSTSFIPKINRYFSAKHSDLNAPAKARKAVTLLMCFMTLCMAAFAGTVSVSSPVDGSNVNSPVHVHATYNGTVAASYMKVWVDHVAGTVQLNTSVLTLKSHWLMGRT